MGACASRSKILKGEAIDVPAPEPQEESVTLTHAPAVTTVKAKEVPPVQGHDDVKEVVETAKETENVGEAVKEEAAPKPASSVDIEESKAENVAVSEKSEAEEKLITVTPPAAAEVENPAAVTLPVVAEAEKPTAVTQPAVAEAEKTAAVTQPAVAEAEKTAAVTPPAVAEEKLSVVKPPAVAEEKPAVVTPPAAAKDEKEEKKAE